MGQQHSQDQQQQQRSTKPSSTSSFETNDHVQLREKWWLPECKDQTIAVVIVLHGYGGKIELIENFAQMVLRNHHISVYAYDQRGFGQSTGNREESIETYTSDLLSAMVQVGIQFPFNKYPHVKLFVMGVGFSATVIINFVIKQLCNVDGRIGGYILVSPLLVPGKLFNDEIVDYFLDTSGIQHLNVKCISRSDEFVSIVGNELPSISSTMISNRRRVMKELLEKLDQFISPVLIQHGQEDPLCSPEGSTLFYEKCGSEDKTLKMYDHAKHTIYYDPYSQTIAFRDLTQWLCGHISSSSSIS